MFMSSKQCVSITFWESVQAVSNRTSVRDGVFGKTRVYTCTHTGVYGPVSKQRCIFLYVPAMPCCMHPWNLKYFLFLQLWAFQTKTHSKHYDVVCLVCVCVRSYVHVLRKYQLHTRYTIIVMNNFHTDTRIRK